MRLPTRRRLLAVGAALVSSALVLSACGGGDKTSSAQASSGGVQTLRIMTVNPPISTNYLDLLADHLGIFKKNGIKAEFIPSADSVTPLIAGDFDVSNIGANGLIPVAQGRPLTFLASPMKSPVVALMVKKGSKLAGEAHNWPQAVTQLKGLTLGTTSPSGLIQQTGLYLASLAGLKPDKDIKVVPAGNANSLVAGLEQGAYDAALVPSPIFETLEAQGKAESILDLYKGEGPEEIAIPWWTPAVTSDFHKKNPDLVTSYQKSLQQALDYARDPANTADMTNFISTIVKVDPKDLEAGMDTFVQTLKDSGEYDKTQWDAAVKMMQSNGVVKEDLAYDDYVIPWKGGS